MLLVLGLLLWWLLPLGGHLAQRTIRVSTGSPTGVYQKYGVLLQREVAQQMPQLDMRLVNSDGSQENVRRVATGKADFTIAAADAVEEYKLANRQGADALRGCARLYDDYVHLVVARSSGIRSVADLKGHRVAVGGVRLRGAADSGPCPGRGRGSIRGATSRRCPRASVTRPGCSRSGGVDAFFWSGGLPTAALTQLSRRFPVRLVPIGTDLVRRLHAAGRRLRYYRAAVMPADAYPDAQHGNAVPTLAVANLLVTRASAGADLTEQLTRTVIDSRDRIGRKVHAAQRVDLRTAIYTDPLPLHEGARRYYRSVKP
ncbi:TAXI family TRAP transporter solute-binding subunit [Streptomyces sp. PG2]